MASFWLKFTFVFLLSSSLISSLSGQQKDKLDEIKELLKRLQKEIDRIIYGNNRINQDHHSKEKTDDDVIDSDNTVMWTEEIQTKIDENIDNENVTTWLNDSTTQTTSDTSNATDYVSSASVSDITTINGLNSFTNLNDNTGKEQTAQSQATDGQSSHFTVPTTSGEKEKKDKDKDKDKEKDKDKDKENAVDKEAGREKDENDVRDGEKVKHLIDEGEDLERQLKGVFVQLRSLSGCIKVDEKCGIRHGLSKCCQGLKCSSIWNGTCNMDCIPFGDDCSENFFCCQRYQCVKSIDISDRQMYTCQ